MFAAWFTGTVGALATLAASADPSAGTPAGKAKGKKVAQVERKVAQVDQQQRWAEKGDAPVMRTREFPGHGYMRYEVLPGDDEIPPGELIVVPATPVTARRDAREPGIEALEPQPAMAMSPRTARNTACDGLRGKLAARLLEAHGLKVDPDVALWLDERTGFSGPGAGASIVPAEAMLLAQMRNDSIARALGIELARCEMDAADRESRR